MKKIEFAQKLKRGLVRAGLSLLAAAAVLAPTDAGAQITSLVVPRSYTILNNVLAGPTQVLSTNLNNGPGGSNIDTKVALPQAPMTPTTVTGGACLKNKVSGYSMSMPFSRAAARNDDSRG